MISSAPAQREEARARFGLKSDALVAVYLGGLDERKGYRRVLAAARDDPEVRVLFAGPASDRLSPSDGHQRVIAVGQVDDVSPLLDAADALVMPSRFEPFGMVAVEAASRGLPALVSAHAGVTPLVLQYGAGAVWDDTPLGSLLLWARQNRTRLGAGGHDLADAISAERQGRVLLEVLAQAHERLSSMTGPPRARLW